MKAINSSASAKLDLLRATTAIAVVINHIRGLYFIDYPAAGVKNPFLAGLYFITGFGHQGVIIFFALSGLLIGSSVVKNFEAKEWSTREFAIARLSRLWVVLLPGLILTFILDTIGLHLTHGTGLYAGSPVFGNIITSSIAATHGFKEFFGNLFFLQTILTKTFGSNTPLWSLANEFWYYTLFPICFAIFLKNKSLIMRIIAAIAAIFILIFVGQSIAILYSVWLFGLGAIYFSTKITPTGKKLLLLRIFCFLQFILALTATRIISAKNGFLSDVFLGISTAIFLWGIMSFSYKDLRSWLARTAKTFAGFSFTLYVAHLPMIILIHGLLESKTNYFASGRWSPDLPHILFAIAIFTFVMAYAYGISLLTEKHTPFVRQKIKSFLRKRNLLNEPVKVANATQVISP